MKNGIVILDFGSQYNQLIARRIREFGVYSEILPFNSDIEEITKLMPKGIILSGGPSSVNASDANLITKEIYELGIPIFGICYGMQLTVHLLGGKVAKGNIGEYGKSTFFKDKNVRLLKDVPKSSTVWMSHFDEVEILPNGFEEIGHTSTCIAGIANEEKKIYATQFHPEVAHTEFGTQIIKNFVFDICKCEKTWNLSDYIETSIKEIKETVGNKKVILGLSGGVDSSVAAMLIHKAIGNQLTCIFVDLGLMRKNEAKNVMQTYGEHYNMNIIHVDASKEFLSALKDVSDPETKRKIIGHKFIDVFNREAIKLKDVSFLAQGTIYPDVIESKSAKGGPSVTIKSHHNVGGLPEEMNLKLLEPLKELFKDEVRNLGLQLGIPRKMIMRHPFPGPGLGIRILGAVDEEKVKILQEADDIFIQELYKNNLYDKVSQAFVVLLPVKSVGVMGDERTYEYTAVIRSANTTDFMTATWSRLPYDFLDLVSTRIINEVKGINRVVYDISSKPPATIEWE
ncbi:MAG: glutamine-hydrolyzing GMP synthase [Chlorobi bacterium]|nr:glutamine-hydrolyzing GMP synthase [Chlorobiota bacterium]